MTWWCFSQSTAWEWRWQAYPGVWLLILAIVAAWEAYRRRHPDPTGASGKRGWFYAGIATLWVALDWPLGPLGASYLASVHMLQFLLVGLVAPAFLLLSLPAAFFEAIRARPRLLGVVRDVTHPVTAFFVYNVSMTVTHWPSVVDTLMASQLGSFALDMTWLVSGIVFWWALVCPVPARPGYHPLAKLAYLAVNAILIRPPFAMLVFSQFPIYRVYELAPPVGTRSALDDQQLAGAIMKVGQGWIMGLALVIIYYRWYRSTRAEEAAAARA